MPEKRLKKSKWKEVCQIFFEGYQTNIMNIKQTSCMNLTLLQVFFSRSEEATRSVGFRMLCGYG